MISNDGEASSGKTDLNDLLYLEEKKNSVEHFLPDVAGHSKNH